MAIQEKTELNETGGVESKNFSFHRVDWPKVAWDVSRGVIIFFLCAVIRSDSGRPAPPAHPLENAQVACNEEGVGKQSKASLS